MTREICITSLRYQDDGSEGRWSRGDTLATKYEDDDRVPMPPEMYDAWRLFGEAFAVIEDEEPERPEPIVYAAAPGWICVAARTAVQAGQHVGIGLWVREVK